MKIEDAIGKKFNMLTVIGKAEHPTHAKNKVTYCLCKCDCGNETIVPLTRVVNGYTKSCGCYVRLKNRELKSENLAGKRFGFLTAVSYVSGDRHGNKWLCKCDCGNEKVVCARALKCGGTVSCGCHRKNILNHTTHNLSKTRLFAIWSHMLSRCNNQNNPAYRNYGGRGITVCDEWKSDFLAFRDWAFQNGYDENAEYGKCTLDRIDVNGNYEPGNCRWVDFRTQANNKRTNRIIEYNGVSHTLAEWAKIQGMPAGRLKSRLDIHKYSVEDALTLPKQSTWSRRKNAFNNVQ